MLPFFISAFDILRAAAASSFFILSVVLAIFVACCSRYNIRRWVMREGRIRVLILGFLPVLAGCATASSTVGQVQDVAPGTYKIGIPHTVRIGHEMEDNAVSQAGQYCHARGQKLEIVPTKESGVVVFRCGEKIQVPDTGTPVTQEPATAAPVQLKPH
jgi:hypothetical protein